MNKQKLAKEKVPNPHEVHTPLELGVSEHLPADRICAHILFIHHDNLCTWVHVDHSWCEALLEFFGQVGRDGHLWIQDNQREKTIGGGSC
jgi:hypothetical protein